MEIRTREELTDYVNQGNNVKYLYFWGHQVKKGVVSKSCLSQWFYSPFLEGENSFTTAEHYMMFGKAKLFGDTDAMQKILLAREPGEVKAIGRTVRNFDNDVWDAHKFELVVNANLSKFSGNDILREFLLATGNRVLVEASPVDRVWGIGLVADDAEAQDPNLWKGENLLGFALMEVRDQLKNATP